MQSVCLKSAKPGSGLCLLDHLFRTGEKGCRNLYTVLRLMVSKNLVGCSEVCGLTGQINPTRIIR
jgi:hypothetical protein